MKSDYEKHRDLPIGELIARIVQDANETIGIAKKSDDREGWVAGQPYPDYVPITAEVLIFALLIGNVYLVDMEFDHEAAEWALAELRESLVSLFGLPDPWPKLTRADVKFMIAGRKRGLPHYELERIINRELGEPMSINEKLVATQYRGWLEVDLEKKRAKLGSGLIDPEDEGCGESDC
jgi:hypothetical protein